jgi:hypothetical protein
MRQATDETSNAHSNAHSNAPDHPLHIRSQTIDDGTNDFTGADDPAAAAYLAAIEAVLQFSDRQDALDAALDRCAGFAVGHAYAAFIAGLLGQDGRARHRADAARSASRSVKRRERQLVEILVLSSHGPRSRAAGLAAEHVLEFPADSSALDAIVRWFDTRNG